jgi:hypothetical protein
MNGSRRVSVGLAIVGTLIAATVVIWIKSGAASANTTSNGNVVSDGNVSAHLVPVVSGGTADGSVQYGLGVEIETRSIDAGITYDYLTPKGIAQYVSFNREALQRLVASNKATDSLPALVTLVRPLTQAEFEAFVLQYHINVKTYTVWVANQDGTTTTILGGPSGTELVPQQIFGGVLADTTARGGKALLGWVDVNGTLPSSEIRQLTDDRRVFLVDVVEALIAEKFTNGDMAQVGIPQDVRDSVLAQDLQVRRPPLAWQVRELGLGKATP